MVGDYGLYGYCLEDGEKWSGGLSGKYAERMQSSNLGKGAGTLAPVKSLAMSRFK